MFALPEYWWFLALALIPQLVFLACLAMHGIRGAAGAPMPRWAVFMLIAGAIIGCGYGLAQSDWVFLLGQSCVLIIAFARVRHQGEKSQ